MLTRRKFIVSTGLLGAATAAMSCPVPPPLGNHHSVFMLNAGCGENSQVANMFEPAITYVNSGDQITFVATDMGHNCTSRRGMIPEGAEGWAGPMNESITVDFTVPGVYGFICVPHYSWGMVGLVVVDHDLHNLAELRGIMHPPDAYTNFQRLFDEVEAGA